jgi:hypothetical protein
VHDTVTIPSIGAERSCEGHQSWARHGSGRVRVRCSSSIDPVVSSRRAMFDPSARARALDGGDL